MTSEKMNGQKGKKPKRRPGRDPVEENKVEEEIITSSSADFTSESTGAGKKMDTDQKKVELNFYGSEIIKNKAPQVFEFAETVATDWVNNGRFENIPISHPLAKAATAYGLRKAKNVEKKLEEKGVFMLAKVGYDYLQSKIMKK